MYGGGHYIRSTTAPASVSVSELESKLSSDRSIGSTPQGQAIQIACIKFGDSFTLPFSPCKKGYEPLDKKSGKRMYACRFHNSDREKRRNRELGKYRSGEVHLEPFWEFWESSKPVSKRSTRESPV